MNDSVARGYRFKDLVALGIITNRTDLHRKQTQHGFPRAVKLGVSQAWFPAVEVHRWLNQRIAQRDRQLKHKQSGKPAEAV
jgi:predicted DNA-binding transcriptional regulator AlpA